MKRSAKKEFKLYGKATRAFVDYEDYQPEECIFYYRILMQLVGQGEIYNSNYFISGIEEIIKQEGFKYKDIFVLRFTVDSSLSVFEIANRLKMTKQGLLRRYDEAYKYIRSQDEKYDISKRLLMLKESMKRLQAVRDRHNSKYITKPIAIETLELKPRTYSCLKAIGIDTVAQFVSLSCSQIKDIPGAGEITIEDIIKNQKLLIAGSNNLSFPQTTIDLYSLELGERARHCLEQLHVKTLEDFMRLSKRQVLSTWHVGEKTWKEIYEKQQMIKFGMV